MSEVHVVTGAFSYTGKYLARVLLARGVTVRTITGHPDRPDPFGGRVAAFPFDFDRSDRLVATLRGASVLYNTYWVRFDHEGEGHDRAVRNTRILFRAAREAGVRRIIHVSIANPSIDSRISQPNDRRKRGIAARGAPRVRRAARGGTVEGGEPSAEERRRSVGGSRGEPQHNALRWPLRPGFSRIPSKASSASRRNRVSRFRTCPRASAISHPFPRRLRVFRCDRRSEALSFSSLISIEQSGPQRLGSRATLTAGVRRRLPCLCDKLFQREATELLTKSVPRMTRRVLMTALPYENG